jgi:hypothetical protein
MCHPDSFVEDLLNVNETPWPPVWLPTRPTSNNMDYAATAPIATKQNLTRTMGTFVGDTLWDV